jgi:hypothetical protein
VLPYKLLFESYQRGDWQFHHEMLHGPCKMFFDIDIKDASWSEEQEQEWLGNFLEMLYAKLPNFERLSPEAFGQEWTILKRMRNPEAMSGNKFSLHLIRNNKTYFASPAALGTFLKAHLTAEDFRQWAIDDKYHEGNLQCIGGTKYEEGHGCWPKNTTISNKNYYVGSRPPMFDFHPVMGIDRNDLSLAKFALAFVNFIHPDAVLVGENAAPVARPAVRRYFGDHQTLVDSALELCRKIDGNQDAEIADVHCGTLFVIIRLDQAYRCCHLPPESAPHGQNMTLKIFLPDEYVEFSCPCRGGNKPTKPLSPEAEQAHKFCFVTLAQIMRHGHDRPDFPIFEQEIGRRGLPPDWHVKQLGYTEFWCHPPRRGTGMAWSEKCWNLLKGNSLLAGFDREEGYRELMTGYVNLFFAFAATLKYVQRTPTGLTTHLSEAEMKNVHMSKFTYIELVPKGKPDKDGNQRLEEKEKPFFQLWNKSGRRDFACSFLGEFDVRSTDFNALPPSHTNISLCLAEWQSLAPESSIKNMLEMLWDRYLQIVTINEPLDNREVCQRWVERWVCEVLFRPGYKTCANLWLISMEHGTGKSTLFEIMVKCLGRELSIMCNSLQRFITEHFNASGNKPLVFFDDAIPEKMKTGEANAFKNLVTNFTFNSSEKYGRTHAQDANVLNMGMAINPGVSGNYIPGLAMENERRNAAFDIMTTAQQEEFFGPCFGPPFQRGDDTIYPDGTIVRRIDSSHLEKIPPEFPKGRGSYNCTYCEDPEFCTHSFRSMGDFWCLMREHVLGQTPTTTGDLFHVFVGMLYERFLKGRASREWKITSVQLSMPLCQAIVKHQHTASSDLEIWMQDCMKRGYLVCPFGGGEETFQNVKSIYWPENLDLLEAGDARWLSGPIPVKTLLEAYKLETQDRNKKEPQFLQEMQQLSKKLTNRVLVEEVVSCYAWTYKMDLTLQRFAWVKCNNNAVKTKCLCVPKFDASPKKKPATLQRRSTLAGASYKLDLMLSRSQSGLNLNSSCSLGSFSDHEAESPSSAATLPSKKRATLADALEYVDGLEPEDPGFRKAARYSEFDLEHENEDEQDSWARREDEAARLAARGNRFVDKEAEEDEEEDEGSNKNAMGEDDDDLFGDSVGSADI